MNRMRARLDALDTVSVMRLGLLTLAVGAVVVTAAELAFLQHWDGTLQLLPWFALFAAAVGVLLLVVRPSRRRLGRPGPWCGLPGAWAMGVYFHFCRTTTPASSTFVTAAWPAMSDLDRWGRPRPGA